MKAQHVVTLENFADLHEEVKGIEIESNLSALPMYVPAEDIRVDVGRIATLARIGRLEVVRFGLFSELPEHSFSALNVSSDGSATAGAIATSVVARSKSSLGRSLRGVTDHPRGQALIRINTEHTDLDDKPLRNPEPWASLLDKGMREGIRESGRKQLFEPKQLRRAAFGIHNAFDCLLVGGVVLATQSPVLLPIYMGYRTLDDLIGFSVSVSRWVRKVPNMDYEHSMIRHLPADRYLALTALSSLQRLVSVKKQR